MCDKIKVTSENTHSKTKLVNCISLIIFKIEFILVLLIIINTL